MNGVILPAMAYGVETWSFTKKQRAWLVVAQRNMGKFMLGITRKENITNGEDKNRSG